MFFNEVKGRFGFGCMRLPMNGDKVNMDEFNKMVDAFIEAGFNYFDTAHGYLKGESEKALKAGLVDRYPRDKYLIANKLSTNFWQKEEDIRPLFEEQLKLVGVDYFDFYLMHSIKADSYEKYKKENAFKVIKQLKEEGKIKHMGMSYHDNAELLDRILTEQPDIEFVQIQFNYIDYEDAKVQSRLCYEVCEKHGIPNAIMEPVKGGKLVTLTEEARKIFADLGDYSPAGYAIKFAQHFPNVYIVLSGMSDFAQMEDNLKTQALNKDLSDAQLDGIKKVVDILNSIPSIPCTGCEYCVDGCPMQIKIPKIFELYNEYLRFGAPDKARFERMQSGLMGGPLGEPADCMECGACEAICPQHIEIRNNLKKFVEIFEK